MSKAKVVRQPPETSPAIWKIGEGMVVDENLRANLRALEQSQSPYQSHNSYSAYNVHQVEE